MASLRVVILGGGMVGQLAKFLFPAAKVLDWRVAPVRKASPFATIKLLGAMYLWEPLEGLPCESFTVLTTVDGEEPTETSVAAYKQKVGKPGDMAQWRVQFNPATVGWRLTGIPDSEKMDIIYRAFIKHIDVNRRVLHVEESKPYPYDILISTIPLPALMEMIRMPKETPFLHGDICVKETPTPLDVSWAKAKDNTLRINYLSEPSVPAYRTTDWEGNRHYEWMRNHPGSKSMGLPTKVISPGKIYPNASTGRILTDLKHCGIYPFGRFGRWAPDELLHMTYKDLFAFRFDVAEGRFL